MYMAFEKYNKLKVFTLQNILCFNGNILKLKGIRFMDITFTTFFPFRAIFIDLNKKQKKGGTYCSGLMLCFISFVCASLNCEKREESEKFTMEMYVSSGNRTCNQSLSILAP